jgi:hypothetical protein
MIGSEDVSSSGTGGGAFFRSSCPRIAGALVLTLSASAGTRRSCNSLDILSKVGADSLRSCSSEVGDTTNGGVTDCTGTIPSSSDADACDIRADAFFGSDDRLAVRTAANPPLFTFRILV